MSQERAHLCMDAYWQFHNEVHPNYVTHKVHILSYTKYTHILKYDHVFLIVMHEVKQKYVVSRIPKLKRQIE